MLLFVQISAQFDCLFLLFFGASQVKKAKYCEESYGCLNISVTVQCMYVMLFGVWILIEIDITLLSLGFLFMLIENIHNSICKNNYLLSSVIYFYRYIFLDVING